MAMNTIYQISREPISEVEYLTESKYYDNFVGYITDYVNDDTDRELDIQNLIDILENIADVQTSEDNQVFFIIKNKELYFEETFDNFKECAEKLSKINLEEYSTDGITSSMMNELNRCYSYKYGTYIDDNGEEFGLITLDDFLRQAQNGDKFYIGATIGYHY